MRETAANLCLIFWHLMRGTLTRDFAATDKLLISYSPVLNSVNDHTSFWHKRFSFNRYGFWGYCLKLNLGTNLGAGYAFLPNFLLWKLGVSGYTLLSLLVYLSLFIQFAWSYPAPEGWFLIVTGICALNSPYFKNATFACGRYDIPGWAFLIGGFWFMLDGSLPISFVLLTLAFMTHPSISIVGVVYLSCFFLSGRLTVPALIVFLTAEAINIFWYLPFLKLYWKRMIASHSWAPPLSDATRTRSIYLKKLCGICIFILSLPFADPTADVYIFSCVPALFFVINCYKDRFVNRFAIELLWVCGAGASLAAAQTPWLILPYLISIYFYASPSPRFSFPYRPLMVDRKEFDAAFSPILKKLPPDARIGFFAHPETGDQYRLDAKYEFLFHVWLMSRAESIESINFSGELPEMIGARKVSGEIMDQVIEKLSGKYGFSHFVAPSHYKSLLQQSRHLKLAATCTLFPVGSVDGTDFCVFETPWPPRRVAPEGEVAEQLPSGFTVRCLPGEHQIRYAAIHGLRAFQDKRELILDPHEPFGFRFTSESDKEIHIQYDTSLLWLPVSVRK